MNTNAAPLIQLDDLKKVFYTDEVETHALSGVHFTIDKGDYLSIAGPSGCPSRISTPRSARTSATKRSVSFSRRST